MHRSPESSCGGVPLLGLLEALLASEILGEANDVEASITLFVWSDVLSGVEQASGCRSWLSFMSKPLFARSHADGSLISCNPVGK